jgi:hypothetical protein
VLRFLLVLKAGGFVGSDLVLGAQLVVFLDHRPRRVQLAYDLINLGRQGKQPIQVVFLRFLAAFFARLV